MSKIDLTYSLGWPSASGPSFKPYLSHLQEAGGLLRVQPLLEKFLNLVLPSIPEYVNTERIAELPLAWIALLVFQGYCPWRDANSNAFTGWLKENKNVKSNVGSWLLQVASSKACRICLEYLQHCDDPHRETLCVMDLTIGAVETVLQTCA